MLRPGERADEQHQPGRAAQISAEVGAERGESDRDGDEAHDLAEQRPGLVVRDRLNGESRLVGGGLERAHVTTTTGTGRRPR
jgi:PP-loop superfamily ATP-utilizing enzyme